MKTKFLRNNPKIIIGLVIILLALFFGGNLINRFGNLAANATRPFLRLAANLAVGAGTGSELDQLRSRLANQQLVEAENRHLKSLLGRKDTGERVGIPATVLARPPRLPYDTLLIDAGSLNTSPPVAVGDLVVVGTVALGKITSVSDRLSRVELFSTPGQNLEIMIGPANLPLANTPAAGRGLGNWLVRLPRELPVTVGLPVWSPALGPYLIGQVGAVASSTDDLSQLVYIRTPINFFTLTSVEVLK